MAPSSLPSSSLSLTSSSTIASVLAFIHDFVGHGAPRTGVMIMIFVISLFAVTFPTLSRQVPFLRIPHILFFIGKHFGTGVILSTAFCHLLQDAFECLQDRVVKERYHGIGKWTGFIILCSLLTIFLIEYLSTSYVEHLQADPSAPPSPSASLPPSTRMSPLPLPEDRTRDYSMRQPLRVNTHLDQSLPVPPPSFLATESTPLVPSYHTLPRNPKSNSLLLRVDESPLPTPEYLTIRNSPRVVRSGSHIQEAFERAKTFGQRTQKGSRTANSTITNPSAHDTETTFDDGSDGLQLRPKVGWERQVVGILVLQLGIMIHSLVIGLTLSITTGADFTSLVTAITFHQLFEGLSLGIRIAALPPAPTKPGESPSKERRKAKVLKQTLSFLFAITTPAGMLLGLWAFNRGSKQELAQMRLTQGLMNAISAGMLIYAATVEMIAGDFVFGDLGGSHPGHGHAHHHSDIEDVVSIAATSPALRLEADVDHHHTNRHDDSDEFDHTHHHGEEQGKGPFLRKLIALLSLLAGVAGMAFIGGD